MLKKTIKYKDFNDTEIEEDFYFNLTKAEVLELNIRADLVAISNSGDTNKIMDAFANVMKASYGVRSHGGAKFVKTTQAWEEFRSSEAYSELFLSFFSDSNAGAEFINALIPADVRSDIQNNTGMTPSEFARARSEAQMQGHNKAAPAAQPPQAPPAPQAAPTFDPGLQPQQPQQPVYPPQPQEPRIFQAPTQGIQIQEVPIHGGPDPIATAAEMQQRHYEQGYQQ